MRMNRIAIIVAVLLTLSIAGAAAAQAPRRLNLAGINNSWRVNKDVITGGTIMSRETAIPLLKRQGIKTVINLAGGPDADAEGAAVKAAGMKYFVFPVTPDDASQIDPMLKVFSDPVNYPVFIHSGAGHRAAVALFLKRVLIDGWDVEKAGIEAASAGLVLSNDMAPVWWKFARDYLNAHGK
jgi:protein tyrosine phosphatase (PTP) superfamily phosphohydrolase (DUF442 family)